MQIKLDILDKLNSIKPFVDMHKAGSVYLVGGLVRDHFLGKQSKDIDLLICGIPVEKIKKQLAPFGKIDEVGESFGVIKFKPNGWDLEEPIDIAIPRTEVKIGDGHRGFEIKASSNIPLEVDLLRRDFTINAMVISLDGKLLDPYHGLDDLKAGIIRMVNPTAFVEDPLRMMRAIQFASRFKFTIEENTWRAILDHADSIKEISGERILIELDKIYYKGDIVLGLDLFIKSTLHFRLFGFNPCITPTTLFLGFDRADFYSLIVKNEIQFINILKGETKTGKLIKAIKVASEKCEMIKKEHLHPARKMTSEIQKQFSYDMRKLVVELYKISEDIFDSILVRISISPTIVSDFITNIFPNSRLLPKSLKELEINGFELMEMGYTGKAIADVQKEILDEIFKDKLENNKEQIKNFLKIKAV